MSVATAWAVLMLPAFCAGGLLLHECSDCTFVESCSHETGCADDPCSVARTQRDDGPDVRIDLVNIAALPAAESSGEGLAALGRAHLRLWPEPSLRPARYSDSGLPLLN